MSMIELWNPVFQKSLFNDTSLKHWFNNSFDLKNYHINQWFTENENDYEMELDIPGFNDDEITISIKDNIIYIEAEQKNDNKNFKSERKYKKCFSLPKNIDHERITAKYSSGVLNITFLKTDPPESRIIKINSE